jgi:drug/metabolite transporter (DMT)-like permease
VLSVGLAIVLLGEAPSASQLAGVVLVVGGIAAATVPLARIRDGLVPGASGSAAEAD